MKACHWRYETAGGNGCKHQRQKLPQTHCSHPHPTLHPPPLYRNPLPAVPLPPPPTPAPTPTSSRWFCIGVPDSSTRRLQGRLSRARLVRVASFFSRCACRQQTAAAAVSIGTLCLPPPNTSHEVYTCAHCALNAHYQPSLLHTPPASPHTHTHTPDTHTHGCCLTP